MNNKINKAYYAIIPANVRYDSEIPANAKLLYGEITALCNEKGFCWATNEYFSNLYRVSKKSISVWINILVKKKYIYSEIIYKEGTKEILHRYLRIFPDGIEEKFNTPMEEKVKENNTIINNTINNNIYSRVIDYLNKKTIKSYRSTTSKTKKLIDARLNEKFTEEDFIKVIDIKTEEWINTNMEQYLRPETLFGTKFEAYLNQNKNQNGGKYGCFKENNEKNQYDFSKLNDI